MNKFKTNTLKSEKSEYKDFFSTTDFLMIDNLDHSYRITKIMNENVPNEIPGQSLVSYEKISAYKMLGILKYLEYKLPEVKIQYKYVKAKEEYFNEETIEHFKDKLQWFEKNIRFFEYKLSTIDQGTTFITPDAAFFCSDFRKKKQMENMDEENLVGRLYNKHSIQVLPREIRYHIFEDEYVDFDMVNSHPSILYEFSLKHKLKLNGSLEEYVTNRSFVFEKINQEQKQNKVKEMSRSEIKELIIKGSNVDYFWYRDSETIYNLHKDFKTIREHLYKLYKKDALGEGFDLLVEYLQKDKEKREKLKVRLQCFYCHNEETKILLKLTKFLRTKYSEIYKKENKLNLTDYIDDADKEINLSARHTLSIIPFFDGCYISSPEPKFNSQLNSFIQEFNTSLEEDNISFEKKEIEERVSYLKNDEELRKFFILQNWLTQGYSNIIFPG